jgi:hypothetical protein
MPPSRTARPHRFFSVPLCLCGCLFALAGLTHAGPIADEKLYTIPEAEVVISEKLIASLRLAAGQPDVITPVNTLKAIARHRITALADVVAPLVQDTRPLVQLQALRTAAVLDLRHVADALVPISTAAAAATPGERECVMLADDLLGCWDHPRTAGIWARRLADPAVPESLKVSALAALGRCSARDPEVERAIQRIVMDGSCCWRPRGWLRPTPWANV